LYYGRELFLQRENLRNGTSLNAFGGNVACGLDCKMAFCENNLQISKDNLDDWKRFLLEQTSSRKE